MKVRLKNAQKLASPGLIPCLTALHASLILTFDLRRVKALPIYDPPTESE